jgi:threonine/homoserine/homoserine lactone efflux protein
MLWSALRHSPGGRAQELGVAADLRADRFLAGRRHGVLAKLLNRKMGAFSVALLPQFIPARVPLTGVHMGRR